MLATTSNFVVVSNRLPVDYDPVETEPGGEPVWRSSPGGLVSALEPMLTEQGGTWVGWPGVADLEVAPFEHSGFRLHPVSLSASDVSEYYEGFSNDTIWPLYHDVISEPSFDRGRWERYRTVNLQFAVAASQAAAPSATVWVHDYQLQLVPALLRELRPDVRIGYFHHIPFPGYNLFAQLPWRKQVLEGLLGADVIGFQRRGDVANFRTAVARVLALDTSTAAITVRANGAALEHRALVRAFPISIDVAATEQLARDAAARAVELRHELGNPDVILLGVDRLDYTKGIGHRLQAIGELLTEGRIDAEKVLFVQIASPSRERVDAYQQLRDEVELTVGRINGDFSSLVRPAISYLHTSISHEEMAALYRAADVMLVTALRDGMNLVAKEFVASRLDNDGVLVLSEFTGAADELDDALIVNPHDLEALKSAIERAIAMPLAERTARMRKLRRTVHAHTVRDWAHDFLQALGGSREVAPGISGSLGRALERFAQRKRVLVAIDFDGTLAPLQNDPAASRPTPEAVAAVKRLAAIDRVSLALVSGRALQSLGPVSSELPEGIMRIGSHGLELGNFAGPRSRPTVIAALAELFETAIAPVEGMRVERKPHSVALHWRAADPVAALPLVAQLQRQALERWPDLHVQPGKAVLEFLDESPSKGRAIRILAEYLGVEATLYLGDDESDESAFALLESGDIGIRVGSGRSLAEFRVATVADAALVLERLSEDLESGSP